MLAKQGWRILNNMNPLVTEIMKARYFPDSDFLHAKLGVNPSYGWRSLLSAQDAIKAGCRRKIGNGNSTMAWGMPWLPDYEYGFMSTEMPVQLQNITVLNLMNDEGTQWDFEVIRDICNDKDIELIKRIPIPEMQLNDSWFWIADENGLFSVRSCYRGLQGEIDSTYSQFWNRL